MSVTVPLFSCFYLELFTRNNMFFAIRCRKRVIFRVSVLLLLP